MKEKIEKNIIPGLVFLGIAVFFWVVTPEQVATTETSRFTAQTFPYVALAVAILCSAALVLTNVIQILIAWKKDQPKADSEPSGSKAYLLRVFIVLLLLILSAALGRQIGLLLAGLLLANGIQVIYRVQKPSYYLVVSAIVVASYFMFKLLFGLNLP